MENSNTIQNEYILAINTTLENLEKARLAWLDYHAKNGRFNNGSTEHSRESVLREFFDPQNKFLVDVNNYNSIAMLEEIFPVIFMTLRTEKNFRTFVDDCEDKLETFGIDFDYNDTFRFVWDLLFSSTLKGYKAETIRNTQKVLFGLKAIRDIVANSYFFN